MPKLIVLITLCLFTRGQIMAFSSELNLYKHGAIALESEYLDANLLVSNAMKIAKKAHAEGLSVTQYAGAIFADSDFSNNEINEIISDMKSNFSPERLKTIAHEIMAQNENQRIAGVLLTFLLGSLLLIGAFLLLAHLTGNDVER